MGREVGGGFMIGNSCTPMADSCQCMAKPIQYCKVKENLKIKKKEGIITSNLSRSSRAYFKNMAVCSLNSEELYSKLQYNVLVFFFLTYFTLYNRLQFHPPH